MHLGYFNTYISGKNETIQTQTIGFAHGFSDISLYTTFENMINANS